MKDIKNIFQKKLLRDQYCLHIPQTIKTSGIGREFNL